MGCRTEYDKVFEFGDWRETWLALADRSNPHNQMYCEGRVRGQRGSEHWLRASASASLREDGAVVWNGLAIDVTERKRAESARHESESRWKLLVENVPEYVFMLERDGTIRFVNRTLPRYGMDEVVGRKIFEFMPVASRRIVEDQILEVCKTGGTSRFEFMGEGETGGGAWYVCNIAPIRDGKLVTGVILTATDVTAYREAEQRAAAEQHFSESLVEALPGLFMLLERDGTIARWNQNPAGANSFASRDVIGRTIFELVPKEHRAHVERNWEKLESDGRLETEMHLLAPSGARVPFLIRAVYIEVADGRKVLALGLELSERVRLEMELRQAQKMEAVGLLAGGVAHDFNNILQIIHGYTRMALDEETTADEKNANLKEVEEAAKRASDLTRQLLAFGRRQPMQARDVDLGEALRQHLKLMRRLIGEHIEVVYSAEEDAGTVRCDIGQIEQVVMNLCINARDAMAGGGRLTIDVSGARFDTAGAGAESWAREGDYVQVSIADTGEGMDQVTVDRIFEPFFTTKGQEKGTGLGLSVVYGIIKQHDGMINVDSEPGVGTTFHVYLPVVSERQDDAAVDKPTTRPEGGRETILLAEDEPGVRMLALKILKRAGYSVLTAADGEEAVEIFASNPDRVDLLLFDVVMPRAGGRAAYERIRELRPDIPVLFCSGYSGPNIQSEFALPPGFPLLEKPYGPDALLAQIRELLGGPAAS